MMQRPPPNNEDPTLEQAAPEFDGTATDQLDGDYRLGVVDAGERVTVSAQPSESTKPFTKKAVITWRGGAETVEASSLADPKLSALLERLANIRARDITVEFIDEGHACDRVGLPTSRTEEIDGRSLTAVYPTCAVCGKPQIY